MRNISNKIKLNYTGYFQQWQGKTEMSQSAKLM